jgi:glutamate dehydrogenase (NAD(P)+)
MSISGRPVDRTGSVVGFPAAEVLDRDLLLELDVTVLVPAAVEGCAHRRQCAAGPRRP